MAFTRITHITLLAKTNYTMNLFYASFQENGDILIPFLVWFPNR